MSTFIGDRLPERLLARLSMERAFDFADRAVIVCSSDEHGWPHPAMLSSFEVAAVDDRNIRLAAHGSSRTARNLHARRRATIILADEDGVFYIKGDVQRLSETMAAAPELGRFNMRVDSVLEDSPAPYEDARLTSGLRIARGALDTARARELLRELTE